MGGGAPVSVQSMCTTKTSDAAATLEQINKLMNAGCELIRVAIPLKSDLDGFEEICHKSPLPVIADIHFAADGGVVDAAENIAEHLHLLR